MEYTKNLRLSKPSYDDDVDIQIINNNMDLLDDKVGNLPYLPLAGGSMKGNITLPYNTNTYIGINGTNKLEFNETSFRGVKKPTFSIKADRLKYYTQSNKEFVCDDTGVFFDGDSLIRDLWTLNDEFAGYTKLSTGTLIQWGFVTPKSGTPNIQHQTFKIPMYSSSYIIVSSRSFYTGSLPSNFEGRWGSATFNFTTTGFDIACAEANRYGSTEFWIAIGRWK